MVVKGLTGYHNNHWHYFSTLLTGCEVSLLTGYHSNHWHYFSTLLTGCEVSLLTGYHSNHWHYFSALLSMTIPWSYKVICKTVKVLPGIRFRNESTVFLNMLGICAMPGYIFVTTNNKLFVLLNFLLHYNKTRCYK